MHKHNLKRHEQFLKRSKGKGGESEIQVPHEPELGYYLWVLGKSHPESIKGKHITTF